MAWSPPLEKAPRLSPPPVERPPGDAPRIFAYCASNVGLGHYARLDRLLRSLSAPGDPWSVLLASDLRLGAARSEAFWPLLRLPGFRFLDDGSFKEEPEGLALRNKELANLRANLLLAGGWSFRPDLVLMDTNPHGKRDEMLPLLRRLRSGRRPTPCALLLRDIPCPPGEKFKLNGEPARILKNAALYDRILIAGDPRFFDPAEEYQWPAELRRKTRHIGFILPGRSRPTRPEAFAPFPVLDPEAPLLVASLGGGWDAEGLAPALVRAWGELRREKRPRLQLALFTGAAPSAALPPAPGLCLSPFSPAFGGLLAHADAALLLAGSTPFQVLDGDLPLLLHARPYKSAEQAERARRLAKWPGVQLLDEAEIQQPGKLARRLDQLLETPRTERRTGYHFEGLARGAEEIRELLS